MSLFPNPTLVHVLRILILHPEADFYQREIAERVSCSLLQIQRALRRIEKAGLVRTKKRGNRVYYSADRRHPAFEELKRILLKTVALGDLLRGRLERVGGKVRLAFVFGSVASGTERSSSDIDLLLVGSLSSRELSAILGPLGREVGREFNPVLYSEEEFRRKAKAGNHFVREVISGPKIWLVGSEDDLAKMAE
jgi:predicted nucleotidyltransferase